MSRSLGNRYCKIYDDDNLGYCVYCGDYQTVWDHVYPISRIEELPFLARSYMVEACVECNAILGNKVFHTIGERQAHIHGFLRNKYKVYLACRWTKSELDELGPNLRYDIERSLRVKRKTQERLKWKTNLEDVVTVTEFLNLGESHRHFAEIGAERRSIKRKLRPLETLIAEALQK